MCYIFSKLNGTCKNPSKLVLIDEQRQLPCLYFLRAVEVISKQAGALMDLREQLHIELRGKPKAVALIDPLFTNPYMTVSRAAELLGVSLPTARQAVRTLEESGVLQEFTGRAWGKTYASARILSLIENSAE